MMCPQRSRERSKMRVYFKGLALGISLLLVLLLLHDQLQPKRSKMDDGTGGHHSNQKQNNEKTSAEKGTNPHGVGKGEGTSAAGQSPKELLDREDTDPVSWPDERAINQQVMHSQQRDIRESDRLQGQQWELQQQRFGIQPRGGHPRPPAKLKDASETWLHDLEFPEWYTDSVKRSRVYGRDKDFVGEGPLYPGPCPDAEKVKEQYKKENIRRYSYLDTGSFLPNSKNPCWYENRKEAMHMRCLPYFYVAGVCKCGTSDLYRRIRYHPDVMEGALKEYHWWDRLRYGAPMELRIYETSEKNNIPVPFAEYSRLITVHEIEDLKKDLKTKGKSVKICGDGSPAYLWDTKYWTVFKGNEGCTEPRIVAGSFIKNANPESKLLLIFRHPTQRLYSRFLSRIPRTPSFKGATSKTFHDFVVKSVAMYKKCFKEHSIRECAYNVTLYQEAVVHVMEGLYSVFLEDWLRIFSRDQLMILRSEDYLLDVEGHIIKVFSFLNLAPLGEEEMKRVVGHWAINVGGSYDKVGPMLPETIEILNEFYKPFVLRLHQLLGEERFLWKDIDVK